MIAKPIRQKEAFLYPTRDSLFFSHEAQRRRFRFISDLTQFLFSTRNSKIMFKEISELIILALTNSEEAYLDKKFFIGTKASMYHFYLLIFEILYYKITFNKFNTIDKKQFLKDINKLHEIIYNCNELNPKERFELLKKERTVLNTYLERI